MAQTLLTAGYSPDNLGVLLGGWTSWQSLGYPSETSDVPAGSQPLPVVPGATIEFVVGTPAPAGTAAP